MASRSSRPWGFTLVEMLVVIAIIAVLAAILFPVFGMVRASARRTQCASNLRQVGQAILLYKDDYNGYLPSFSVSHPSWGAPPADKLHPQAGVITWDLSIQNHLKSTAVLVCPDNPFGRGLRSYAITAYCMKPNLSTYTFLGERVENISNLTGTVFLFEKGMYPPGAWGDAMGENVRQSHGTNDPPFQQGDYSAKTFHNGGKNFMFLDGHVAWFRAETGPFVNPPGSLNPNGSIGACLVPQAKPTGDWPDKK